MCVFKIIFCFRIPIIINVCFMYCFVLDWPPWRSLLLFCCVVLSPPRPGPSSRRVRWFLFTCSIYSTGSILHNFISNRSRNGYEILPVLIVKIYFQKTTCFLDLSLTNKTLLESCSTLKQFREKKYIYSFIKQFCSVLKCATFC